MPRELRVRTGIKVDTAGLQSHLSVWSAAMKKSSADAVKEQAGLLCQDLLSYTLPVDGQPGGRRGESLGARDVGVASMNRDIDRIFKPLESASYADIGAANDYGIFAEYVAARRKAGMAVPQYVAKAFDGYFDATKAWMRFRSAYGYGEGRKSGKAHFDTVHGDNLDSAHINARGGTNVDDYAKKVKANKDVYFVGDRDSKVRRYKETMKSHVGRMKSAWLMVGWKLGRKMRAPAWIAAHVGAGDDILEDRTSNTATPSVIIGNRIQGKMTKSPGKDLWKTAVNYRAYAMRVDIYQRLLRATRGSGTSVLEMARRLNLPFDGTEGQ